MTRSAGWCPGPGTPAPVGLKGRISGILVPLAFSPRRHQERRAKIPFPISEMDSEAWLSRQRQELPTPHFPESQGLHLLCPPRTQVPLTTVHPPLLACRWLPPAVRPLRPAPPPSLQSLRCTKEVPQKPGHHRTGRALCQGLRSGQGGALQPTALACLPGTNLGQGRAGFGVDEERGEDQLQVLPAAAMPGAP